MKYYCLNCFTFYHEKHRGPCLSEPLQEYKSASNQPLNSLLSVRTWRRCTPNHFQKESSVRDRCGETLQINFTFEALVGADFIFSLPLDVGMKCVAVIVLYCTSLSKSESLEIPSSPRRSCVSLITSIRYVTGNQTWIKIKADSLKETGKHERAQQRWKGGGGVGEGERGGGGRGVVFPW